MYINYRSRLNQVFLKDKNIKTIFRLAKSVDTKIWIVGGAIRDFLIGKMISDIDFVINTDVCIFILFSFLYLEGNTVDPSYSYSPPSIEDGKVKDGKFTK